MSLGVEVDLLRAGEGVGDGVIRSRGTLLDVPRTNGQSGLRDRCLTMACSPYSHEVTTLRHQGHLVSWYWPVLHKNKISFSVTRGLVWCQHLTAYQLFLPQQAHFLGTV